jgi:hypothetical protein
LTTYSYQQTNSYQRTNGLSSWTNISCYRSFDWIIWVLYVVIYYYLSIPIVLKGILLLPYIFLYTRLFSSHHTLTHNHTSSIDTVKTQNTKPSLLQSWACLLLIWWVLQIIVMILSIYLYQKQAWQLGAVPQIYHRFPFELLFLLLSLYQIYRLNLCKFTVKLLLFLRELKTPKASKSVFTLLLNYLVTSILVCVLFILLSVTTYSGYDYYQQSIKPIPLLSAKQRQQISTYIRFKLQGRSSNTQSQLTQSPLTQPLISAQQQVESEALEKTLQDFINIPMQNSSLMISFYAGGRLILRTSGRGNNLQQAVKNAARSLKGHKKVRGRRLMGGRILVHRLIKRKKLILSGFNKIDHYLLRLQIAVGWHGIQSQHLGRLRTILPSDFAENSKFSIPNHSLDYLLSTEKEALDEQWWKEVTQRIGEHYLWLTEYETWVEAFELSHPSQQSLPYNTSFPVRSIAHHAIDPQLEAWSRNFYYKSPISIKTTFLKQAAYWGLYHLAQQQNIDGSFLFNDSTVTNRLIVNPLITDQIVMKDIKLHTWQNTYDLSQLDPSLKTKSSTQKDNKSNNTTRQIAVYSLQLAFLRLTLHLHTLLIIKKLSKELTDTFHENDLIHFNQSFTQAVWSDQPIEWSRIFNQMLIDLKSFVSEECNAFHTRILQNLLPILASHYSDIHRDYLWAYTQCRVVLDTTSHDESFFISDQQSSQISDQRISIINQFVLNENFTQSLVQYLALRPSQSIIDLLLRVYWSPYLKNKNLLNQDIITLNKEMNSTAFLKDSKRDHTAWLLSPCAWIKQVSSQELSYSIMQACTQRILRYQPYQYTFTQSAMETTNEHINKNDKEYGTQWYKAQAYLGHYNEIPNQSWTRSLNQNFFSDFLQLPRLSTTLILTQDALTMLVVKPIQSNHGINDQLTFGIDKTQRTLVQTQAIAGILAILKLQIRALQRWSYIKPKKALGIIKPSLYDRNVQIQDHISTLSILQHALGLKKHGLLP